MVPLYCCHCQNPLNNWHYYYHSDILVSKIICGGDHLQLKPTQLHIESHKCIQLHLFDSTVRMSSQDGIVYVHSKVEHIPPASM